MTTSETVAITGAFSYTGKYITRRLLASGNEARTPTAHTHLADWLKEHRNSVGRKYASELARHYR